MAGFFNTLTLLFVAASLALLWLNWREWRRKKVVLAHTADHDMARPSVANRAAVPPLLKQNLQSAFVPSVLFPANIIGTGIAAPPHIDTGISKPMMENARSEPVRELMPASSCEPVRDTAVDLEAWVANFEAVIKGHSSRRAEG